jgi:peptidoglycan/xylan/chitin deacetylase (PgdA/CDA1 family)
MSLQANRHVSIVMYHFVRDLRQSRFPEIKGLSIEEFRGQIEYIRRYYNVIDVSELISAFRSADTRLPPRALLLTFDDGYRDHFDHVLPILAKNGLTGCFFPPAKAVAEQEVLDVNKIHFILAAVFEKIRILNSLFALLDEARGEFNLLSCDDYYRRLAHPNRFDTAEVMLIKRLLQRELPEVLRKRITDKLFKRYVTQDEAAFSQELYMSASELRTLIEAGMHIGSHGYDHYWLNTLNRKDQEGEIDNSLAFLRQLGCSVENWVMCYPYGGYNDSLIDVVKSRGCRIGFAVDVGIAHLEGSNPFALPRLDTNDLPKQGGAAPNEWTLRAINNSSTAAISPISTKAE